MVADELRLRPVEQEVDHAVRLACRLVEGDRTPSRAPTTVHELPVRPRARCQAWVDQIRPDGRVDARPFERTVRFQRVVADGVPREQCGYELVNGEFVEGAHLQCVQGVAGDSVEERHSCMFSLVCATITVWR